MSLDLPSVPPPPPPRPKFNKPITLITGCGMGIGAVVVVVTILFVLAVVVLPRQRVPMGKMFTDSVYAKAESNKNLSEDQLSVYGEINSLVNAPEASVFAVNVGGATLYAHLKDGAISEEEIAEAKEVRDALAKDPAGGVFAMMSYVKVHPEIQQGLATFARDMALSGVGKG